MTEIRGFRALHYNTAKIKEMSKVVCPPYDVISPAQQDEFYKSSEYNFIRILLTKDKSGDDDKDNKYARAKQTYEEWLREGILIKDEKPSIYYYLQEYKVMGEKYSRLGIIALMRIADDKGSKIYPHENTHARAKEDRMRILQSLHANLSPIFVCFSDHGKIVEKIFYKDVINQPPFIKVTDEDKVIHTLWRLEDPELIAKIEQSFIQQQLFIADGHHRFEVAKEYRRQRLARLEKATGEEPFHFTLTYFTNMDSKDLKIFPMHRIVRHFPMDLTALEEFFRIDRIAKKEDLVILLAKAGRNEHSFGLYTRRGIYLLRLKNKLLIDKYVKEGSKDYRQLDATILKYFVFDRVGVTSEDIIYTKDYSETLRLVDEGAAEASFIMNPVRIQQLKNIALNSERMPPKTTYFYPKVLSGLTVYTHD